MHRGFLLTAHTFLARTYKLDRHQKAHDQVAGVEWVVLTGGDEYRIYNTHAPVVVEEKLFRSVKVTAEGAAVTQTLELLAKNRLEENRIEVLWRAHFVDRQVRAAIEGLFSRDHNDMLLVNYVAGTTKNLTADEIRGSLGRCRATFDFPLDAEMLSVRRTKARSAGKVATAADGGGGGSRRGWGAGGPDRDRRAEAAGATDAHP